MHLDIIRDPSTVIKELITMTNDTQIMNNFKTKRTTKTTIANKASIGSDPRVTVSLKTLSHMLDAGRSSVRRWLKDAGIQPIAMGDGPKSAIRYRWQDVEAWLASRDAVE